MQTTLLVSRPPTAGNGRGREVIIHYSLFWLAHLLPAQLSMEREFGQGLTSVKLLCLPLPNDVLMASPLRIIDSAEKRNI